jgi:hypothetical protein
MRKKVYVTIGNGVTNIEEYCKQDDTFWVLAFFKANHKNLNLNRHWAEGLLLK